MRALETIGASEVQGFGGAGLRRCRSKSVEAGNAVKKYEKYAE